jgi:putative Holliday junction resolvase
LQVSEHPISLGISDYRHGAIDAVYVVTGGVVIIVTTPILIFGRIGYAGVVMRFLGIDYGSKRVGLALSDESGTMAFPHGVVPNDASLLKTIVTLITEKGVGQVVIGHSLGRDGLPNKIHAAVEALMTDLTLQVGIPVHLEPEHYSTQAALQIQGRTDMTDASAAALLLNSFLTRNHKD